LYTGEDSILAEATEFMEQYRQNLRTAQTSSGVKDASEHVTHVVTTYSVPVKANLSRQKTAVSMIFKEDDTNFSGSQQTKVPLHEVRDAFVTAMTDHEISRDICVELMHVCLSVIAKKFYYRSIRGIVKKWVMNGTCLLLNSIQFSAGRKPENIFTICPLTLLVRKRIAHWLKLSNMCICIFWIVFHSVAQITRRIFICVISYI